MKFNTAQNKHEWETVNPSVNVDLNTSERVGIHTPTCTNVRNIHGNTSTNGNPFKSYGSELLTLSHKESISTKPEHLYVHADGSSGNFFWTSQGAFLRNDDAFRLWNVLFLEHISIPSQSSGSRANISVKLEQAERQRSTTMLMFLENVHVFPSSAHFRIMLTVCEWRNHLVIKEQMNSRDILNKKRSLFKCAITILLTKKEVSTFYKHFRRNILKNTHTLSILDLYWQKTYQYLMEM